MNVKMSMINDSTIIHVYIQSNIIFYHYAISFLINIQKPKLTTKSIQYRKVSSIDIGQFIDDFKSNYQNSICIESLNTSLINTLNKLAPLKTLTITDRNSNKWYDDECANHKRILRKAERDYRKTYNNDHLDKYCIFQREHNRLLYEKNTNIIKL